MAKGTILGGTLEAMATFRGVKDTIQEKEDYLEGKVTILGAMVGDQGVRVISLAEPLVEKGSILVDQSVVKVPSTQTILEAKECILGQLEAAVVTSQEHPMLVTQVNRSTTN